MDKADLVSRAGGADILLGVFGTTPQSLMTVQNKIYEGLAMAKPVLTGDSPAISQVLTHGQHVYLCDRANPHALAKAIENLSRDPDLRSLLATNGQALFQKHFTLKHIGGQFHSHLQSLVRA
jgi:glycosyltransferase involved in cell wall biosynthesis